MTLAPTTALILSLISPAAVVGAGAFYLDTVYTRSDQGPFLTVKEYKLAGAENNVQKLQNEVDSLQWDVDHGEATEKEEWLLEQKKKQLLHWEKQVIKIRDNRSTA